MRLSAKIDGFDSIGRKLDKLLTSVEGVNAADLEADANIVLERMQQLVPVDRGDLKESLGIKRSNTRIEVVVGPIGKAAWRAHFIEFGTLHITAQPFIRPTFDETRGDVTRAISRRLKSSIRSALKGG